MVEGDMLDRTNGDNLCLIFSHPRLSDPIQLYPVHYPTD
jgi:hypothetical protein